MKIELTEKEIEIIELFTQGEADCPIGETEEILGGILDKALAYEKETGEDSGDDLLVWYYNKYKQQKKGNS